MSNMKKNDQIGLKRGKMRKMGNFVKRKVFLLNLQESFFFFFVLLMRSNARWTLFLEVFSSLLLDAHRDVFEIFS